MTDETLPYHAFDRPRGASISRRGFLRRAVATGISGMSVAGLPLRTMAAGTPAGGSVGPPEAVVSGIPSQTIEGIGASGAWWPNDLVAFDPEVRERVAQLLFAPAPAGIGLSVYRYNLGGGGTGVTNPTRAPETFLVRPGEYDWERDRGGRLFLRLAARHDVPVLIGFVNSAPGVWTTNGRCCGGSLKPGVEADYARYLADVVEHFEDDGIRLSYVSPMNEPDFLFENASQEGMGVPVAQRGAVVRALGRELASRGHPARVMADESSQVGSQFLPELPRWLTDEVRSQLAVLAHHLYDFPNSATLTALRHLGQRYDRPLWSTEFCCFRSETATWGQQYDPTIANAIVMADLIWSVLTQSNDAAVLWWVALSSAIGADPVANPEAPHQVNGQGWNDGLLYYDPNYAQNGNQRIYPTKRYYALGNFSRYVRPGAVRHDVLGVPAPLRALAFRSEGRWTAVAINAGPAGSPPARLRLRFPSGGGRSMTPLEAVETSADADLEAVALPRVSGGRLEATLPAQSVTTFVLDADGRPEDD